MILFVKMDLPKHVLCVGVKNKDGTIIAVQK